MNHKEEVTKGVRVSTALENIRLVSKTFSKDRRREAKAAYKSQFCEVDATEALLLQEDWSNLEGWECLNATQA